MTKPADRPTNVRWIVFFLACATSWFLYLHRYAWGVIKKDIQEEFDLSTQALGWLDSCFSIAYAAGQVPVGLLGDVLGPAMVLPIIVAAWSLSLASMWLGKGFWSFAAIRLSFGATQAGAYPNLGKVTKAWFPSSIRTTLQGLVASFSGRFGGACGQFLIPVVLMSALGLGWRETLVVLAVGGIGLALVLRWLLRDTPADHPWSNEKERRLIEEKDDQVSATSSVVSRWSHNPLVWVSFGGLLFHIFTSAFADQIYVNWVPYFLEDAKGMSKAQMGVFASLPLVGGAIGGMCGGFLNDRLRPVLGLKWARRSVGLTGKIVAGVLVLVSLTIPDARGMMVVIAFAKFFTDWSQPTVWGAVTDIAGRDTGRVFGTVNMMGSLAGFAAGPIFSAILGEDPKRWGLFFGTIAGIYFVSGAAWLIINTTRPLVEDAATGSGSHA